MRSKIRFAQGLAFGGIGLVALGVLAGGCSAAPRDAGGGGEVSAPQTPEEWRRVMTKAPAPKGTGCFEAVHPGTTWQEVPCVKPPLSPLHPAARLGGTAGGIGTGPATVGNPTDFSPKVTGLLSWAEGSFPSVQGVTAETDSQSGNAYSLQLNTNTFPEAPLCAGAKNQASCTGWEQFVFQALPPATGSVFIQYWLLGYGNSCPSGWTSYTPKNSSINDCYRNSDGAALVPNSPDATQLGKLSLTGTAGSSDTVTLSDGDGHLYRVSQATIHNLDLYWNDAEFNVFGYDNSSQAIFDTGATIVVQTVTDSVTPTRAEPACTSNGYTGETNNLSLLPGSCCRFGGDTPGIQFVESNTLVSSPYACPSLVVSPSTLQIAAGYSATTLASVVGNLVGQTSNTALQPTSCIASGQIPGSATPASGVPGMDVTFSVPYSTAAGSSYADTVSCDNGQSAVATIDVGSPELYPNPSSATLVQGTCTNIDLVWANPALAYCTNISYQITNALPAGITASVSSAGLLDVCDDSATPAPLGNFVVAISSNGCTGNPYNTFAIVDVVSQAPCQPRTCVPDSCQGTVSDGCGGTLNCPSSCSADYDCMTNTAGDAPICCAPTQIVNGADQCACPTGKTWNPSAGVIGECVPGCPTGESLCPATGTCLTTLMCQKASGGGGTCKPGTCS